MKKFLYVAAVSACLALCGCQQKPEVAEPSVTVLGLEGDMALDPAGGPASFSYAVESPVEGGRLEVSAPDAEAEWVYDFEVVEEDNVVNFSVLPNETGDSRHTWIRVVYVYGENRVETGFEVVQDPIRIWEGTPDIIVRDTVVPAEGGPGFVIYYINYPRDGVVSMKYDEVPWVHDVKLDLENTRVTFTVDPNSGEKRQFTVTLMYTYEGGEDVQDFTVIQVGTGEPVQREMRYAKGEYNGTDRTTLENAHEYHIYMSTLPFDVPDEYAAASASYDVHLYAAAPADPETMLPPAGTYPLSGAITPDVFALEFRDVLGAWHTVFNDGELNLGYDDSGNMTVDILATDGQSGDVHKVTFTGQVIFTDIRE